MLCFCFVKPKTAYEGRISDWSSDVCSSDLLATGHGCMARKAVRLDAAQRGKRDGVLQAAHQPCGRAWQPGGNLEPLHAHYAHQWLIGALAPHALDGSITYAFLVDHMAPEFGDNRGGREMGRASGRERGCRGV